MEAFSPAKPSLHTVAVARVVNRSPVPVPPAHCSQKGITIMPTSAQINANRNNAKKSTGPRTGSLTALEGEMEAI